jgi:iron complex transport system ATP-binding protein
LLTVNDIQIPYSRKKTLPTFSIDLVSPALLFITGANGIGKSTLLKLLSGAYPNNSVLINNRLLNSYTLKERAKLIGFLKQAQRISFPILVKDLVVMGRYNAHSSLSHYSDEDFAIAYNALLELGIEDLYNNNFQNLSGGEQQLCLLAQLAVQNPHYILLDEPTQNLDLHNKEKVFKWMSKAVSEKGKTIICATHDLHWLGTLQGYLLNLNHSTINMERLNEHTISKTIELLRISNY